MSALFFKRFLQRPFQIASIIPSSKALVERVAARWISAAPRVIAEYGPGEGVHSREIARRMRAGFAIAPVRARSGLSRAISDGNSRMTRASTLFNGDAARLPEELERRGIAHCDYILSGIPFSILEINKKRALLQKTYEALAAGGSFIIYQVTNELRQHATFFDRAESEYFLQNIPPMFITVFHKANTRNGTPAHLATAAGALSDAIIRHDVRVRPASKRIRWAKCPSRIRALWRFHAARGPEFSDQRLSIFAGRSFARSV